jgi:hypothetical protein
VRSHGDVDANLSMPGGSYFYKMVWPKRFLPGLVRRILQ